MDDRRPTFGGHGVAVIPNAVTNVRSGRRATAAVAKGLAIVAPGTMEKRVRNTVFFIGSGRSGTNLLAGILATHPDLAVYPHEANELWHPSLYPWSRSAGAVPPIWRDPYAFTAASLSLQRNQSDRRLRAVLGGYQTLLGARYVVNKSVLITFMIPYVLEMFPDARFLHLVRDGRAVAYSFAKMERGKIDRVPAPYRERGLELSLNDLLDDFARHWREHIAEVEAQRRALDLDGSGRLYELRYEDLCADPARELSGLASFLDIDAARLRAHEGRLGRVDNRNHKFREELDAETVARMTVLMQPELSQKGYGDRDPDPHE